MSTHDVGIFGRAGKLFHCVSQQGHTGHTRGKKSCMARKLRPMSEENRILVQQMLMMMVQNEKLTAADVGALIKMLNILPASEDILREVDPDKQLNLLQWTVIRNSYQFLQELISGPHIICLNCWYSNGPLHLACKLGHTGIIQLLLSSGASHILKSTACYPYTVRQSISNNITSNVHAFQPNCRLRPRYTPLQCTLMHDQLDVLRVLMDHPASWDSINTNVIMSEACEFKAIKCIKYIISVLPHTFNSRTPPSGKTVLYRALLSRDMDCLALVLQCGGRFSIDVQLDASGTGDSVLHVLYGHSAYVSMKMYQITTLLDEGEFRMQKLISSRDSVDNTPLHVLSRYIGQRRNGPYNLDVQNQMNEEGYQTARYLIEKGADIYATNKVGQTPIHMLFECNARRPLFNASIAQYHSSMPIINKILELFLESSVGAANVRSEYSMTVFNHVTAIMCGLELDTMLQCGYHFHDTVQILMKCGVNPDLVNGKGIHILTELLTASNRWLTHSVMQSDEAAGKIINLLHGLLKVLFDGGMRPPDTVLNLAVKQIAIMTNIQFDSIKLYKQTGQLFNPLFTSGLNPNEYFLSANAEKSVIYIARGLIMHRHIMHSDGIIHFFDPILQFVNQHALNRLIQSLVNRLQTGFEGSLLTITHCERELLTHMRRKPRPLLTLVRITIIDAMNWKLLNARKLPLPEALKQYLTDFD